MDRSRDKEFTHYLGLLLDDRYEIKSSLARGGFGTILIAEDLRTQKDVAVKFNTS